MFIDRAKISIKAGDGGDGMSSFHREKFVAKGGPDGGDGGRGGDVVFVATEQLNTLLNFRYQPKLKAEDGVAGGKKKMAGRGGERLLVKVPVGTLVKRKGVVVADLDQPGQEMVIARGGDGGFGNAHFKSSVRQTPRMAELGEAGEQFEAELELKLLADVGLIGFPNAGKSTFLSVISNARPEIADYAFTTLTPNLGVADVDDGSILIADIPGLIEGASEGKGLGDAFLRHVERTAVLLHMIDSYSNDIASDYQTIRRELERYSPELVNRPEVIALTKTEGLDDEIIAMQLTSLGEVISPETPVFAISSLAHKGLTELLRELRATVRRAREADEVLAEDDELPTDTPTITLGQAAQDDAWQVEKQEGAFVVTGAKIEKFARRTNFDQHEAVNRLRDIMKRFGIYHELVRQGADGGSIVRIGDSEFTLVEQN